MVTVVAVVAAVPVTVTAAEVEDTGSRPSPASALHGQQETKDMNDVLRKEKKKEKKENKRIKKKKARP